VSLLCLAHHVVRLWRSPRRWPCEATNPVQIRWISHVSFPLFCGRWLSLIRRNRLYLCTCVCVRMRVCVFVIVVYEYVCCVRRVWLPLCLQPKNHNLHYEQAHGRLRLWNRCILRLDYSSTYLRLPPNTKAWRPILPPFLEAHDSANLL